MLGPPDEFKAPFRSLMGALECSGRKMQLYTSKKEESKYLLPSFFSKNERGNFVIKKNCISYNKVTP